MYQYFDFKLIVIGKKNNNKNAFIVATWFLEKLNSLLKMK